MTKEAARASSRTAASPAKHRKSKQKKPEPSSGSSTPSRESLPAKDSRPRRHGVKKTDRVSSTSFASMDDWDLPRGAASPSDSTSSTPAGNSATPFSLDRMSTLPEGDLRKHRREAVTFKGGVGERRRELLKGSSATELSLLEASDGLPADVAAEVEELRSQLADERARVEGLRERKELLIAEGRRVRAERDEVVKEQGRLTEKLAQMEGQMFALKASYEREIVGLRQEASQPVGRLGASAHAELTQQVALLTMENEGLRCQIIESSHSYRTLGAEIEAAEARAGALERKLRELQNERERERIESGETQRRLEFMLQDADIQAEKRARDVDAARRDAREQRQLLAELGEKLVAAEAHIAHQALQLASAEERAEVAESARDDLLRRSPGSSSHRMSDDKRRELEREVARLKSALMEKEAEASKERGLREAVELERRETREAMEVQTNLIRDKMKALKKEKEMAVAACEKRMATMQHEIAVLVDLKDANHDVGKKARASVEKAEQYLKALDVARLEVKRLRLERDLLSEKIRVLEKGAAKGGASEIGLGWFMPECLLKRALDAQVTPLSSIAD